MTRACPKPEVLAAAKVGDKKAIDIVIRASMWIVEAQARRAKRPEIFEDLVQVGLSGGVEDSGLLKAIKSYDPEKGANFWTHATVWIWGAIRREVVTRESDTLAGRRRRKRLRARTADRLTKRLGREATTEEIDEVVGAEPVAWVKLRHSVRDKDSPRQSSSQHREPPETSDGMSEGAMMRALLGRQAVATLEQLPDLERRAVQLHVLEGKALTDVGEALGVSREWARQYVIRGTARLRAMLKDSTLQAVA